MTTSEAQTQPVGVDPRDWLSSFDKDNRRKHFGLVKAERSWSWGRLISFLSAVGVLYILRGTLWLGVPLGVGILVVFGVTVSRHGRARARRELWDRILLVTEESARRCREWLPIIRSGGRPYDPARPAEAVGSVLDNRETWLLTAQECDDLDFYATPVGLFGLLNRTSTLPGARRLRDLLESPLIAAEAIRRRQQSVRWLDEHSSERLRLMASAAVLRNRDEMLSKFVAAVHGVTALPRQGLTLLMRVWSVPSAAFTLAALVAMGRGHLQWAYGLFALILLNGAMYSSMRKALERCLSAWRNVTPAAQGYAHVAAEARESLPQTDELGRLREYLFQVSEPHVLPVLCRRIGWSESGGILHNLCNLVFFFDVHIAEMILRKALPHRDALQSGLSAMADLDALCSLATFAFESRAGGPTCYPEISERREIEIRNGRHPQLTPAEAVGNDAVLTADSRLWIVTGPNMAGKSTFLRLVGVNCVLGQAGTAVPAGAMTVTPVRLITDLRVRDNLGRHESYFLAEVRQLHRMVAPEDDGSPILGLIDEPFRGTNSDEQVAASLAVVDHLLGLPHLFVVATHEQRLTGLADERGGACNYHFHEELGEAGMVFDYRLRPGPAVTRNALDVLEREAYPQELIDNARRRLNPEDGSAAPSVGQGTSLPDDA